ncbi:hypothetical protein B0H11DRAFT_2022450 [Mycena galericulata]|nr:hypothetical protein B0H11DRAFT_2022450 [Mycena galericulata]
MSQPDAPPAKRQRTEQEITRSEIWHDDGSVVLQAEETQFRVHWGVLSSHSSFFRDMRGCPLIELPDSSVDLQHLLGALYDPLIFLEATLPFQFIAAIVRLGRKYVFSKLLAAAVERLTHDNPATLEEVDQLQCFNVVKSQPVKPKRITFHRGILFDTIALARANNLYTLLPYAYARAVMCPPEVIFDGIPSSHGPIVMLAPADQRASIVGRKKLLQAQWDLPQPWKWLSTDDRQEDCIGVHCDVAKKRHMREFLRTGFVILTIPQETSASLFCSACERCYLEVMAQGRKELWAKLPTFFDLPPWGELKDDL